MRTPATVGLVLLIGVGLAGRAYAQDSLDGLGDPITGAPVEEVEDVEDEDDGPLRGTPVDPALTLMIRLPDVDDCTDAECDPCSRVMTVPNVVTGQRVPVPRRADGTCPRIRSIGGSGSRPTPIELEPKGCIERDPSTCTHWIQHKIGERSSEHFDPEHCEVVVDEAIARDEVHRKALRRLTPLEKDHLLGQPPTAADVGSEAADVRSSAP